MPSMQRIPRLGLRAQIQITAAPLGEIIDGKLKIESFRVLTAGSDHHERSLVQASRWFILLSGAEGITFIEGDKLDIEWLNPVGVSYKYIRSFI